MVKNEDKNVISKVFSDQKINNIDEKHKEKYFYVFFSVDLSDSTRYKAMSSEWPKLVKEFYRIADSSLFDRFTDPYPKKEQDKKISMKPFHIWKYIGDEIIFFKKVIHPNEILLMIKLAQEVIKLIPEELSKRYPESAGIVYAKGTFWGADVIENDEENVQIDKRDNILINMKSSTAPYEDGYNEDEYNIQDFIGSDIDLGFRISKLARKNELLVSAELLYIISQRKTNTDEQPEGETDEIENKFRILSLEELKGIWNKRKYPIIIYRENWNEDLLDYDEGDIDKVYPYFKKIEDERNNSYKIVSEIKKIFRESGQLIHVENMLASLNKKDVESDKSAATRPMFVGLVVHIAGIIVTKDNYVLVRERQDGSLDFGCVHLSNKKTVSNLLNEYYANVIGSVENHWDIVSDYTYKKSAKEVRNGFVYVNKLNCDKEKLEERMNSDQSFYSLQQLKENKEKFVGDSYTSSFIMAAKKIDLITL